MSFSYSFTDQPAVAYVRLLISDTQEFAADGTTPVYVFSDQEVTAAYTIQQSTFQSAQFYSPPAGQTLASTPASYFRVAAILLDCMVANKSKLASVKRILDVELDPAKAAQWLRDLAAEYRDVDDNSGSFMIIEQVNNQWSLMQRYNNQIQRQQGLGW